MERPSGPAAEVPGVDGDGLAATGFVPGALAADGLAAGGFGAGAFSTTAGAGAGAAGCVVACGAVAGAGSEFGRINSHPRIANTTRAIAPYKANGRRLSGSSSSSTAKVLAAGIGGVVSRSAMGAVLTGGLGAG